MLHLDKASLNGKDVYALRDGSTRVASVSVQKVEPNEVLLSEWRSDKEGRGYGKILLRMFLSSNPHLKRVRVNGFTQSGRYNFARVAGEFGFTPISRTVFYKNNLGGKCKGRGWHGHPVLHRYARLKGGKMKAFGHDVVIAGGGRQPFLVPWKQRVERVACLDAPVLARLNDGTAVGNRVRTAKIVYYPRGLIEGKKR
jgi:hypothetical protein